MVIDSTYSWSLLPMSHRELVILVIWVQPGLGFVPRLLIVNLCGSFPSRRMISGRMRRRALMNQLQTWVKGERQSFAGGRFEVGSLAGTRGIIGLGQPHRSVASGGTLECMEWKRVATKLEYI